MARNGTTSTPSLSDSDSATDSAKNTTSEIASGVDASTVAEHLDRRSTFLGYHAMPHLSLPRELDSRASGGAEVVPETEGCRIRAGATTGDTCALRGQRTRGMRGVTHRYVRIVYRIENEAPFTDDHKIGLMDYGYSSYQGGYLDIGTGEIVLSDGTNENRKSVTLPPQYNSGIVEVELDYGDNESFVRHWQEHQNTNPVELADSVGGENPEGQLAAAESNGVGEKTIIRYVEQGVRVDD